MSKSMNSKKASEVSEYQNRFVLTENRILSCRTTREFMTLMREIPPVFRKSRESAIKNILYMLTNSEEGYSILELADACGVSESTIKKIRKGNRFPSKYLWVKFGLLLNLEPEEIRDFMHIAGYALNVSVIPDAILYFSLINSLSLEDVFWMLQEFSGNEEAERFLRSG